MMYSAAEMARTYAPADTIRFSRGRYIMTAETADRLTYGLVVKDRETGRYRRVCLGPSEESGLLSMVRQRDAQADPDAPPAWASSRPR